MMKAVRFSSLTARSIVRNRTTQFLSGSVTAGEPGIGNFTVDVDMLMKQTTPDKQLLTLRDWQRFVNLKWLLGSRIQSKYRDLVVIAVGVEFFWSGRVAHNLLVYIQL